MSDESGFWDTVRPLLLAMGLDPIRVENVVHDGFPDVSYTHGLIELKDAGDWPRSRGRIEVGMRRAQPPVLARRWMAGGLCWVLCKIGGDWLLFDGWTARLLSLPLSREELLSLAAWTGRGDADNLLRLKALLRGDTDSMEAHDRLRFYRLKSRMSVRDLARDLARSEEEISQGEAGANSQLTGALLDAWEC